MTTRELFQVAVAKKFGPYEFEVMGHWDTLSKNYGEYVAATVILEALQKFKLQLATASLPLSKNAEAIREQLEIANKQKIEANSLLRLRGVIERLRKNIGRCSIDGVELTQEEIEQAMPKVPECFKNGRTTYVAHAASKDSKVKKLTLEIIS
ncbi:MAG TPA: hypothetical protein P5205_20145 [Candidatus Paceibacterota bacterium]|nr:hypothetical protein [Verrucomicrobiota bacterium]HSA12678.1 hypothetical protein [Candidatus Paceibacterota bacterium]